MTWLSAVKAAVAAHAILCTGIAAAVVGVAGVALAGITRATGPASSSTVTASSSPRPGQPGHRAAGLSLTLSGILAAVA